MAAGASGGRIAQTTPPTPKTRAVRRRLRLVLFGSDFGDPLSPGGVADTATSLHPALRSRPPSGHPERADLAAPLVGPIRQYRWVRCVLTYGNSGRVERPPLLVRMT